MTAAVGQQLELTEVGVAELRESPFPVRGKLIDHRLLRDGTSTPLVACHALGVRVTRAHGRGWPRPGATIPASCVGPTDSVLIAQGVSAGVSQGGINPPRRSPGRICA